MNSKDIEMVFDDVYMENFDVTFAQEPDSNQKGDEWQYIEFHSENNGVGNYYWIKTKRWAFSSSDELYRLAQRVREMEEANNKHENRKDNEIYKR